MSKVPGLPLLVVDDDAPIRKLLARVAERAGFDVDTAKDGREALQMLERKEYVVAIVDLMMPHVTGYDLVQKISTLVSRPIVLVATAMRSDDVASLDDSMVRRIIPKPFDIEALNATLVETACEIRERQAGGGAALPPIVIATDKVVTLHASDLTSTNESATTHDSKTVEQDGAARVESNPSVERR